jgi:hypothetical protein
MENVGMYTISVNCYANLPTGLSSPPAESTVGVQLFQNGTPIAVNYVGTSIVSTDTVEPGNILLIPCSYVIPIVYTRPNYTNHNATLF